ncbi:MAG: hypothetical protein IKW00_02260 [Clostridia bacterium]|nr:hypothetical protein [Clostridia bacterium]
MIIAFCGHRQVEEGEAVCRWLEKVIDVLAREGAEECWFGGKGQFSRCAAETVTKLKTRYPHLRRVLVQAYMNQEGDPLLYDEKMYPPIEDAPLRFAMQRRDRYMALNADVLVTYAKYGWGNSTATKELAQRKGKRVINYPDAP